MRGTGLKTSAGCLEFPQKVTELPAVLTVKSTRDGEVRLQCRRELREKTVPADRG